MVLQSYEDVAGFNLEGFYFREYGGIVLREFVPTKDGFESLLEVKGYLGVCFIFDNIEKLIWIYQDDAVKTKKYVRVIKTEKKDEKLAELTKEAFEKELNYDISGYSVKNALSYQEVFSKIYKYQINEYPLYTQHYLLPEYEEEEKEKAAKEEAKAEASANIRKCANCGWIISANAAICPKCRRPTSEKFEIKKEGGD